MEDNTFSVQPFRWLAMWDGRTIGDNEQEQIKHETFQEPLTNNSELY